VRASRRTSIPASSNSSSPGSIASGSNAAASSSGKLTPVSSTTPVSTITPESTTTPESTGPTPESIGGGAALLARTRTCNTLSAGPPWPVSLNHATPSRTRPKNSLYSWPTVAGARTEKLKRPVAPGATTRSIVAALLPRTQSLPRAGEIRSRGCVVPMNTSPGRHVSVPVLRNSKNPRCSVVAGRFNVVDANGKLCMTNCAEKRVPIIVPPPVRVSYARIRDMYVGA
jgi:hypothetical protein